MFCLPDQRPTRSIDSHYSTLRHSSGSWGQNYDHKENLRPLVKKVVSWVNHHCILWPGFSPLAFLVLFPSRWRLEILTRASRGKFCRHQDVLNLSSCHACSCLPLCILDVTADFSTEPAKSPLKQNDMEGNWTNLTSCTLNAVSNNSQKWHLCRAESFSSSFGGLFSLQEWEGAI